VGCAPWLRGAVGPLAWAHVVCTWDIFILNEIRAHGTYFGRHFAWLKYFTCHSLSTSTGSKL
jgi:hypothetical protein